MSRLGAETADAWQVEMSLDEVELIPPMTVSTTGQLLADQLVAAAGEAGWRLELEANRGGVSFPNFLPEDSRACVIDGLGPVGGGMHTRGEFLDLESLERRISLIAEALIFVRDRL